MYFQGLESLTAGLPALCSGRSTGQAYVQFATAELANKALERNRYVSLRRCFHMQQQWNYSNVLFINLYEVKECFLVVR